MDNSTPGALIISNGRCGSTLLSDLLAGLARELKGPAEGP